MKKTLFLAILSFGIPMSMAEEPRATVVPVVESSDEETGTTEDEEGDYEGDYEEEEDIVYTDEQKAEVACESSMSSSAVHEESSPSMPILI